MSGYMVSMHGASAPSKIHTDIAIAEIEAHRLAKLNPGKVIAILKVMRMLRGQVEVVDLKMEDLAV